MVRGFRKKDRRRYCNENMEDGSGWTPKDKKNKTELERCYAKRYEGETSTERRSALAQDRIMWRIKN